MKPIIIILLFSIGLFGCKKFEHENLDLSTTCELCDWADSIEGTYAGIIHGYRDGDVNDPNAQHDTTAITIQHVFLNQNPYHDSTVMYFDVTRNGSTTLWSCKDDSKTLERGKYKRMAMYVDSLEYHDFYAYYKYGLYVFYSGTLYR